MSVPVTDHGAVDAVLRRDARPADRSRGDGGWPEFQLGENVSLYLIDPTNIGQTFTAPHSSHIALRVAGRRGGARASSRTKGVEFDGEILDTGVCHMAFFHDPDGNALMLHRRYAPR